MDVFRFEQDGGRSFLCYQKDSSIRKDEFAAGMLVNNKIPATAVFICFEQNDTELWKYDVTGFRNLQQIYGNCMKRTGFLLLLKGGRDILDSCRSFMLDPDQIILSPEYVFVDTNEGSLRFLILPLTEKKESFSEGWRRLLCSFAPDRTEDTAYYNELLTIIKNEEITEQSIQKMILRVQRKPVEGSRQTLPTVGENVCSEADVLSEMKSLSEGESAGNLSEQMVAVPGRNSTKGTGQTQAKEEKKRGVLAGLFGKKKKEKKEASVVSTKNQQGKSVNTSFGGLIIPGVENLPEKKEDTKQRKKSGKEFLRKTAKNNPEKDSPERGNKQAFTGITQKKTEKPVKNSIQIESQEQGILQETGNNVYRIQRIATGEQYNLKPGINKIGRNRRIVDIYITENPHVGRLHTIIYIIPEGVYIEDNGSSNGTYVNGNMIQCRTEIHSGDRIRLGNEEFILI